MARGIALFVAALAIGYLVGFADGRRHDRNIVIRVVERVGGVAENTVGERQRRVSEEIDPMNP